MYTLLSFIKIGPLDDTLTHTDVCNSFIPGCLLHEQIEYRKCDEQKYIFKLGALEYCGAYCTGS